jgi:hypothetical protein
MVYYYGSKEVKIMDENRKTNKAALGCITILGSVIILIFVIGLIQSTKDLRAAQQRGRELEANISYDSYGSETTQKSISTVEKVDIEKMDAYLAGRGFIEERLQFPSDSAIQPYDENSVLKLSRIENMGDLYSMMLWADSVNAYGSTTRITFDIIVEKKDDIWNLIQISNNINN